MIEFWWKKAQYVEHLMGLQFFTKAPKFNNYILDQEWSRDFLDQLSQRGPLLPPVWPWKGKREEGDIPEYQFNHGKFRRWSWICKLNTQCSLLPNSQWNLCGLPSGKHTLAGRHHNDQPVGGHGDPEEGEEQDQQADHLGLLHRGV